MKKLLSVVVAICSSMILGLNVGAFSLSESLPMLLKT